MGSVFEPRTWNHPFGSVTFTPSRVSVGRCAKSRFTMRSTSGILFDGQVSFSLIITKRGRSAMRPDTVWPVDASR